MTDLVARLRWDERVVSLATRREAADRIEALEVALQRIADEAIRINAIARGALDKDAT